MSECDSEKKISKSQQLWKKRLERWCFISAIVCDISHNRERVNTTRSKSRYAIQYYALYYIRGKKTVSFPKKKSFLCVNNIFIELLLFSMLMLVVGFSVIFIRFFFLSNGRDIQKICEGAEKKFIMFYFFFR